MASEGGYEKNHVSAFLIYALKRKQKCHDFSSNGVLLKWPGRELESGKNSKETLCGMEQHALHNSMEQHTLDSNAGKQLS